MEMLLILFAGAAAVLACVAVTASFGRTRRSPLRTRREEELADGDEEAFLDSLRPVRASPIERSGAVLNLEPIEPDVSRAEAGRESLGEDRGHDRNERENPRER